jgi:hypothetical protein
MLFVVSASDYIIGILAIVLLVFTASDYNIGILAIGLVVFSASEYNILLKRLCKICKLKLPYLNFQ